MIPYIINVALILAGCLAFYKILLHKETFYKMNRYVLILCLFIAFSLPLLPMPQQWSFRKAEKENTTIQQKPTLIGVDQLEQNTSTTQQNPPSSVTEKQVATVQSTPAPSTKITFHQVMSWLIWLYWFGVIVFAFNFLLQVTILLWKAYRNPVIKDGRYRIVEVSGDKAPCSFGNNIFINPEKYEWETYNQILLHEKIHVRQKHSLDILIAELVLIFQWFNPFAWIYRREIESNLEFLTDDQLMQKEQVEKSSYQMSLLKVSAPHFPLSLTTNYNQSILKKRILMMNSKRSNLHTAWKYFFLLPLLALFACLLNEPVANSQPSANNATNKVIKSQDIETEGSWFAVIKNDKIIMQFKNDDDDVTSFNSSTFKSSEFSNLPQGVSGNFKLVREPGTMEFTGKFEGNTGMGHYKFIADKAYGSYMSAELKDKLDDRDQIVFFFIDIKKDYLQMLKSEGYTVVGKNELIPLAALKIDAAYIKSLKDIGLKDLTLDKLIPLRSLGVDAAYTREIREAGYKDVTANQLITLKSQGIDKDYIGKMKSKLGDKEKDKGDPDDLVTFKAMDITDEFANSFKSVGFTDMSKEDLIAFKSLGITSEFIKSFQDIGYKDLEMDDITGLKSLDITPGYIREFEAMGYKHPRVEEVTAFKSLGVTREFIKSFEAIGYHDLPMEDWTSIKALGITPDFIKGFEAIGYKNIPFNDLTGLKAVGVTPEYITSMKEKGFNYDKLQKYITLKSID